MSWGHEKDVTYAEPASGVIHLAAVDTKVSTDCNHVFRARIRGCKAGSTVDSRSTDWSWTTCGLKSVLDFLDSTIEGRAFDDDRFAAHTDPKMVFGIRVRVVVEGRIGNDPEPEGLRILGKEGSSVFGLSLDNFVVPVTSATSCGCEESVWLFATQVLDAEWIHNLFRIFVAIKNSGAGHLGGRRSDAVQTCH